MPEHTPLIALGVGIACRRARSSPHRAGEERKGVEEGVGPAKVPRVAMDYLFMANADEKASVKPLNG